jgi:nucleotide-binding universal stress UspA family protein
MEEQMTRSILLATDLSARCDRALDRAAHFATAWPARLVVVHALQERPLGSDLPSWRIVTDPLQTTRSKVLEDLGEYARLDIDIVVDHAEPVDLIRNAASRFGCELIITGVARDETLGRFFLGTTVNALARKTDVPVLVVKSRPRHPYHHVIVATDFSDGSRCALESTLALFPDAEVTLFHAFGIAYEHWMPDKGAALESTRMRALSQCEEFIASSPAALVVRTRIHPVCEYGEPGALLSELVRVHDTKLVALGTAGRTGLASVMLGSTAARLSADLAIDVLLVRRRRS